MTTTTPSTALVPAAPLFTNTERLALAGSLAGVPLRDVQEAASHADPTVTQIVITNRLIAGSAVPPSGDRFVMIGRPAVR